MKSRVQGPESEVKPATPPQGGQVFKARAGQTEFMLGVERHRISGFLCRRQYGKTTNAGRIALKKMMRTPGHSVVFGSVKLDLAREIIRKESGDLQKAIGMLMKLAEAGNTMLQVVNVDDGKSVLGLCGDDFADIYEHSRLELRLYHDRTVYSRTKVVALTPDAVGETGDLILDEVGRVKNFREVWEAVSPIIASNPEFRCILTTTPPPDDAHYSFELLAPPIGTELPVSPTGNWYRSDLGVWVLRVDAWDAFADGVPLYDDDTGKPISPDESRKLAADKDAWDRNYGVKFVLGGSAAVGLLQLDAAQRRGVGQCKLCLIEAESDLSDALAYLRAKLGKGKVGIGVDWATTEKQKSNPTSVSVTEQRGADFVNVVTCVWKTNDPATALSRLTRIVEAVNGRPEGGRARALCQDASSEKYFCDIVRKALGQLVIVRNLVSGETIEIPGREPMTLKAYLGNQCIGVIDDNHATLPPERYLKNDFRLVKRDRGSFTTEMGPNGEHGDTFDSFKNSIEALVGRGGAFAYQAARRSTSSSVPGEPSRKRERGLVC